MITEIYNLSPVWVQNLMCSIKGWFIQRRRFGKSFHIELLRYNQGYYNQRKELVRFLNNIKHLPAYAQYLNNIDITPDNIYDMLFRLPIIDKNYVKAHMSDFINTKCTERLFEMRTSGTTGSGLIFPYTINMENRQWAIWWRYRLHLGITMDTWCGWFGGKNIVSFHQKGEPYWRINRPGKQIMFSSYHLNKDTVMDYLNEIANKKLVWLHGYPSHIARLAHLTSQSNTECIAVQYCKSVKYITFGAENLYPTQIDIIQKVFPNAKLRQHYGLNEGVANISQDINGNWVTDDDFAFIEFIPKDKDNPNVCKIIGTGFSNNAFALVRYDTGDLANVEWMANGKAKVISIDGRSSNVVKLPNGVELCEASLSIFLHDYPNIMEAQFHQQSIDKINLLIVRGCNYSEIDENRIKKRLPELFNGAEVFIKYVDEIPRTSAGIFKIVKSDI